MSLNGNEAGRRQRGLVWIAGTGIGAIAAIDWEIAEYNIMQAGAGNLHLTYVNTLGDLAAGTIGGAIGAWLAITITARWWQETRPAHEADPPGSWYVVAPGATE